MDLMLCGNKLQSWMDLKLCVSEPAMLDIACNRIWCRSGCHLVLLIFSVCYRGIQGLSHFRLTLCSSTLIKVSIMQLIFRLQYSIIEWQGCRAYHGGSSLVGVHMAIEEDVHSMLVGEGLHGHAHLLKLLVAVISGVPAEE